MTIFKLNHVGTLNINSGSKRVNLTIINHTLYTIRKLKITVKENQTCDDMMHFIYKNIIFGRFGSLFNFFLFNGFDLHPSLMVLNSLMNKTKKKNQMK